MYQRPASPRPIGGVLGSAFRLLTAAFTQVAGLAILSSAITGVGMLFNDTFDNLAAGTFDPEEETSIRELLLGWLGNSVGLYLYLGVVARLSAFASNRPVSIAEALRRALLRFPALLVCVLVLAAPFALVGTLTGFVLVFFLTEGEPTTAAWSVTGIVGLLTLTPALVVSIYLHLAAFLIVTADVGSVAALRRSFRLVRRNFWRTTALQTIGVAATTAVSVGGLAMAFLAGFLGNVSIDVAAYLILTAVSVVTTPFLAALSLALLRDLELRHEGEGLVVWR